MNRSRARTTASPGALPFDETAGFLKALGHPLRLRLVCGLCLEPSNLTRIVAALETPLSTVALHLGVLRRAGILREERRGAEVYFRVEDGRVRRILEVFCAEKVGSLPEGWQWRNLARVLHKQNS